MPRPARLTPLVARATLVLALAATSCTGSISGDTPGPNGNRGGGSNNTGASSGNRGGAGSGGTDHGPPPASLCGQNIDPGPSPMRLLTRVEYANTIKDLMGGMAGVAMDLPEDGRPARGFANDTTARSASDLLVDKFSRAAEKLATQAVGQLPMLLGGCDPAKDGEAACLNRFLDGFAKRAWRRPLQPEERANLTRAFNENKAKGFADGLEAVTEVVLMAPQFLYRYEQGIDIAGKKYAQLSSWEVASRLSYLMWGSMPDAALFAAAEKNELGTPEQILAQARRMVDDERYMPMVKNFVEQFLELDQLLTLDKDTMTLPKWSPELRPQMMAEADKFIETLFAKSGDGKLTTMLTAPYSYVNPALAGYYGVTGGSADYGKTAFPADRFSGVLTMGGWLAVHGNSDDGLTSLVYRAKWVKEELLCQPIPDPPPNALDENPPFTPTTTAREWSALRQAKMVCGACHKIFDPIGFGFENYDAIGKWRDQDHGKKVDATGMLIGSDVDAAFDGPVELGKLLAKSKTVSDCMATQWFRYAAGRADTTRDQCSLQVLQKKFDESGGDMRELLVQFTQTDAFLFRSKGDAP
ncbi:MAG TPA: DUF1592 domain-containing protein [Polyangia bacterium]|nr:DUF1592 domain-containing protein [Polyangia bacterium]